MPTAVPIAPRVRLKRPEPCVRSATTRTEYSSRHAIQDLDRDQRHRVVSKGVENGANRKGPKGDEQHSFLPHKPAFRPAHEASDVMTSCVVTTHADMNSIELRPLPLAGISPNSGSIAALAK